MACACACVRVWIILLFCSSICVLALNVMKHSREFRLRNSISTKRNNASKYHNEPNIFPFWQVYSWLPRILCLSVDLIKNIFYAVNTHNRMGFQYIRAHVSGKFSAYISFILGEWKSIHRHRIVVQNRMKPMAFYLHSSGIFSVWVSAIEFNVTRYVYIDKMPFRMDLKTRDRER